MERKRVRWTPPLMELPVGAVGHPLAWEKNEADGTGWAWVSRAAQTGGRQVHKVIQIRASSLRPLEPPEAHHPVLRRVCGLDGKIRDAG